MKLLLCWRIFVLLFFFKFEKVDLDPHMANEKNFCHKGFVPGAKVKDGTEYNWATTWQNQRSESAPGGDSDQPGHPPRLIRVFAVRLLIAKDTSFFHADSEDSDQTGRMPRLIWVFAGCTVTLLVLSWRGSYKATEGFLVLKYRHHWQYRTTDLQHAYYRAISDVLYYQMMYKI